MNPSQLKRELDEQFADVLAASNEREDGRLEFILADRDNLGTAVRTLRDAGITHLITITGVDSDEQVDVLYHFLKYGEYDAGDLGEGIELTLRVTVPDADPTIETISDQIPAAGLYERELMDMLGVEVAGHPNPKKLLLPDDYDGGPPLRAENVEVTD
ncbi:NADH-quinone oxidoreductase subunit C [Halorhabdus sp. CUG00001]|uniref:NADH-quinone oxidoreductase subunit C n=1 Tax=Halorhabdus sp. CUG00001 TaxID=2600297 RepID=UPI00131CF088|nr:NADH-quinone oxidoreductase subunit C [Halorhabdus sp. CUG00001]